MLHLIALSLKKFETKHEGLRPLKIVVPADQPKADEWCPNMAAQVPNPKQSPSFKNDTKSEPGIECFVKIIFHLPSSHLIFDDIPFNAVTSCMQNP